MNKEAHARAKIIIFEMLEQIKDTARQITGIKFKITEKTTVY